MPELSTLGATIKTAYEGQANTNPLTDAYDALLASLTSVGPTILVQDEGSNLVARHIVNFVGAGVSAVDDFAGLKTVVTIPGGGTSSGTVRASTGVAAGTAYTHSIDTALVDLISGGVVPATAFGIYPNSGVDETTRIQNALLDLQNEGPTTAFGRKRALYFQNGVYLTTAGINSTVSTAIVGDGGAVFQFNGTHGANTYVLKVTISGGGSRITYGICRGIKINGLSPANELAETGIWCATATDWSTLLSQVHITNCGLYGVRVAGATNLLVSDFRCDAVGRSAIRVEAEDTRQNLIAVNQGTVTWNAPANSALWSNQSYIPAGSVNGLQYWGAAVLELMHTGTAGGGAFVAMRDMAVEWHFDGDTAGHGVILDRNASTNVARQNRLHLSNIRGFTDSTTVGHQIVGFRGTNGRQPIVTAHNASLDGSFARPVRDFTTSTNYGDANTTSFSWASGGAFFAENGATMAGVASARPAASSWLDGFSYFATDTLALSFHVNGAWLTVAGGSGGTALIVQDEGTALGTQPALNFVGAGVTVTADGANNRNVVSIPGGGGSGSGTIEVQQFGSSIGSYAVVNYTGNVSVADDPVNSRVNINLPTEPAEATAGGALTPGAIAIPRRQTKYSQYNQGGAVTFALDLPNCTYNLGEAIFYFNSNGAALTWNANLVYATSGINADLPATLTAGIVLIVISFDEANNRGLVYFAGGTGSGGTANALPLAGGTMTGALVLGTGATIDGGGKQIANSLRKVVTGVTGTLTAAAHGNNIILSGGDIGVPDVAGFYCDIIMTGAHRLTYSTKATVPFAANDWVTLIVTAPGVIYSQVALAGSQPVFSGAAPSIIGSYGSSSQAAGTNQNWTTYVLGSGATLLVVTIHLSTGVAVTTNSVTWTATGASAQVMTFKVNADDGTGNQAYIFYLYSPNVGTAAGAGTIHATINGAGAAIYFTAYSIKDVAIGATPISGAQGGANVTDPAALSLAGVLDRSLLIHAATAQATGITATFGAGETKDLDAAGTNFRAATSHKSVAVGGTITVDLVWSGAPTKTSDAVIAFGGA